MENLLASSWVMPVILIGFVVLMVVWYLFRSKTAKKQEEDRQQKLNSLTPGVKILTIDYTYGTIVSSTDTEVVIETGDEDHKGYVRLDKRGIYRIIEDEPAQIEEQVSEEQAEPAEEPFDEIKAEETPAEETNEQPAKEQAESEAEE